MNKLLTKIVGIALGATMAIGVGAAIGASNKKTVPVHAENVNGTATITFADLSLNNEQQYTNPFTISNNSGDVATITFAGGNNDGKYYTTGSGIRTYGSGTITITALTGNLTSATFTWSGDSYKPTSNVADVGTYNNSTATWSGAAEEFVLTRPSGSGHWRLQSVTVTTEASGSTKTDVTLTITGDSSMEIGDEQTLTVSSSPSAELTYTFTSSDPTVASVGASTGFVTALLDGTTTITVTSDATDDYNASSKTFDITVTDPNQVVKFTFPDDDDSETTGYSGSLTATNSGYTLNIEKFNTNNAAWTYIACGQKSANSASVATMTTSAAISSRVTSVVIAFANANNSGLNSSTLYVSSTSSFNSTDDNYYATSFTPTANGRTVIDITSNSAKNLYYKIEFDCKAYSSSNGWMQVKSVKFSAVPQNELDSVSTSGQTASFTAGNKWSYGGTLTAHYTINADATVTPTSFKYGASGINPTTAGTAITTDTTLNSDFNGKYIYVVYTEGGITKWASYQITVNAAPATSVTLSSSSSTIAVAETFDVTTVTATVNPSAYATQGVTWEVYDADGLVEDDTYMFDGTEFYATEPADVVFHVKANSNGSIYAVYTLTISGDPIVVLKDDGDNDLTNSSTSVFADAGDIYFEVTADNFEGTIIYSWSSSNTSVISIDDGEDTAACMFFVEGVAGNARLSCHVQGSTKGDVTVYVDVTVSAVTVTSVTWNAPTINVYSGATLSTAGWNVRYSTNSGKTDQTPDSFDILLGGSVISNGYAFDAADDGKTLAVRVGGTTSGTTTTVSVTQTLQAVMATETSDWSHTIAAKTWSAYDAQTINGKSWTAAVPNDDGDNFGYDATKGQQFGKAADPCTVLTLSSSGFSGTIEAVKVTTSGASSVDATLSVKVGSSDFKNDGNKSVKISATSTQYTFVGSSSGEIVITWTNSSAKALYIKGLVVSTVSGSHDIANASGHEAAQKAVVAFAKAMNEAFDDTSNCTTGVAAAWATASSAYSSNIANNASLSADEKAYAKNLIKYADAEWTDDTDDDYSYCLERAMATYEACIQKHGQTAFMSDVRPVSAAARITPLSFINGSNNAVTIIVIISLVSLTAIGGYFFLRKRKEVK